MSSATVRTSKKIDMVFVLALFTLFSATALVLVLIGAKQYRYITDTMNKNHTERTVYSYLAEKIRQHDTQDAITICDLQGVPALSVETLATDISYTTYIYCYDNALRELVVTNTSVFSLSSGQVIMEIQQFTPKQINPSLLCAEIIDKNGNTQTLYFTIHSDAGKESS